MSANETQVGGDHYKMKFETWDVIHAWGLGYFDGNAVKYLSRWRKKGGVQDLHKAKHYILLLQYLRETRCTDRERHLVLSSAGLCWAERAGDPE